jgi:gamma-glutamylcyclotransferase
VPATPFFYFAFGSNLSHERMRQHCPSARFIVAARLSNHRLAFTLESRNTWHGGVADVLPSEGDEVWGALWQVDGEDSRALDEYEGVHRDPPAYERYEVMVETSAGDRIRCRSYHVVSPNPEGFAPSPVFKRTLLEGARECGLPQDYIARLAAIPNNGYEG